MFSDSKGPIVSNVVPGFSTSCFVPEIFAVEVAVKYVVKSSKTIR